VDQAETNGIVLFVCAMGNASCGRETLQSVSKVTSLNIITPQITIVTLGCDKLQRHHIQTFLRDGHFVACLEV
jgi:hypothetical protein